jgi:dephospho-CoA kinase
MFLKDIAFTGLAGAGKNAAAELLIEFGWKPMAFADPIKEIAQREFTWNQDKDAKGRRLLQELGSAGRAYKINFWVDRARSRMLQVPRAVWTDVRFQNEVDFIKNERKGLVIRIVRNGLKAGTHESEAGQAALSGVDFTVENNGTILELHNQIAKIILNDYKVRD